MTKEIKKIYKSGLENYDFLQEIKEADGDERPNLFDDDLIKHFFCNVYYGWLVGKYGVNWKQYL